MPYKLRKAPKRDLYWVVNKETGKKYSKEPMPKDRAVAQMRALYASETSTGGSSCSLTGGAIHKAVLQQIAQSAYSGRTRLQIGPYKLIHASPTLKFYHEPNSDLILVGIRGTQLSDKRDLAADYLALGGRLRESDRYKADLETLKKVQRHFSPTKYRYVGIGHSLGGAILDLFLRDGLIKNGLSYNPLVEPQEMGGNPKHHRIYHKDDPLYKWFGHKIPNVEVRTTPEPMWKFFLKHYLPEPLGDLFQYYDRHKIRIFRGGAIQSAFKKQLSELGIDEDHYLDMARRNAADKGYDPKDVEFSDNTTHKLMIRAPDGSLRRFGRVCYNDFLIWSHLEENKEVMKGTAKAKQDRFWKSHMKIKGDWKDDKYSPNWLALNILW